MGNEIGTASTCTGGQTPDTRNQCSLYIDDIYHLPHFCTLSGLGGKQNRIVWCGKLGTNEWGVNDASGSGSCQYDDCGAYKESPGGCCNGCCAIAGSGVDCKRERFNGTPIDCCINDLECNGGLVPADPTNPACFSDPDQKLTCDPCQRSLTSNTNTLVSRRNGTQVTCGSRNVQGCQEIMLDYCSGVGVDDQSWFARWVDLDGNPQECMLALERNLFQNFPGDSKCQVKGIINLGGECTPLVLYPSTITTDSDGNTITGGGPVNALSDEGVIWGRQLMNAVFAKYKSQDFVIGAIPGTPGYSSFQDFLYSLSCQVPIITQDALDSTCSIYTAQRLSLNPDVANWCGCYLPDAEYTQYVDSYQINKECTPMCNRSTTIPIVAGDNTAILCDQTVCIIDDITINLNNSNLNGGINIGQICGNCAGTLGSSSSCSCIVENNTVDAANAELGSINLLNSCSSTTCTVKNPGYRDLPATIAVPCDQSSDPNSVYAQAQAELEAAQAAARRRELGIYLLIIGIFLLLLLLLWFFIRPEPKVAPPEVVVRTIKPNTNYTRAIGTSDINGYRYTYNATEAEIGTKSFTQRTTGAEIGTKSFTEQAVGTGTGASPGAEIGSRTL